MKLCPGLKLAWVEGCALDRREGRVQERAVYLEDSELASWAEAKSSCLQSTTSNSPPGPGGRHLEEELNP